MNGIAGDSPRFAMSGSEPGGAGRTQRRLALLAALMALIALIGLALRLIVPELRAFDRTARMHTGTWPLLVLFAVSAAIAIGARSKSFPAHWSLRLGVALQIFVCWEVTVGSTVLSLRSSGQIPMMTLCEVLIVFFPLILGMRPLTTLLAAITSALIRVPAALIASRIEDIPLEPMWAVYATVGPAIAVLIAFVGSVIVFGLSLRGDRALDVGNYHLEKLIGRGGMGEVWQARHQMLARPAAIKFVTKPGGRTASEPMLVERFEREALATAQLKSPNTVELYDYGQSSDGTFFYVMELLEGINLQELVERFGAVVPERAAYFGVQICSSLSEAHALGLVHRDIKPSNLLACRFGLVFDHIKVVDFGLVGTKATLGSDSKLSGDNQTIGSPAYISPEAARSEEIDERSDIYGIGCVLYWLLAGRLVFNEQHNMAMGIAHATEEPDPLSKTSEYEICDELGELVLSCLAKDRESRPQSAIELSRRLQAIRFETPWDLERAENWWNRHRPLERQS